MTERIAKARRLPSTPKSPTGRYYSRMYWTRNTDEGSYDVEFWVGHTGRISIMDMTNVARIEFVNANGVGFAKGRELDRVHGFGRVENVFAL